MYEKILVELFFIKIKIGKILEKFAYNLVHCINMFFFLGLNQGHLFHGTTRVVLWDFNFFIFFFFLHHISFKGQTSRRGKCKYKVYEDCYWGRTSWYMWICFSLRKWHENFLVFFFISMIGLSVCKVNPAQANKLSPYSRNYHPEEKQPEIEKTIFSVTLADAKHSIFVVLYWIS